MKIKWFRVVWYLIAVIVYAVLAFGIGGLLTSFDTEWAYLGATLGAIWAVIWSFEYEKYEADNALV